MLAHIESVSKSFGDTRALIDVTLSLNGGEILGLVGANGSGKTTLLRILGGYTSPSSGNVSLFGESIRSIRKATLRKKVGMVGQDVALDPDMGAKETLLFFADLFGLTKQERKKRMHEVCEALDLGSFLLKQVAHLSGGQRQRLHLAIPFLQDPEILLLDEPSTALDPKIRQLFWSCVREFRNGGKGVVVATHDLTDAERHFDRLAFLSQGKVLIEGEPGQLRAEHARPRLEIRFSPSASMEDFTQKDIEAWPEVEKASVQNHSVQIRCTAAPKSAAHVIARFEEKTSDVLEIHHHGPTLEEAYFGLTGLPLVPKTAPAGKGTGRGRGRMRQR